MPVSDEELRTIPEKIRFHIQSVKAADLNILIFRKYKLKENQPILYYELIKKLFLKTIRVSDLPIAAAKLFNFSEKEAMNFACDVAGTRLLVVKDWLGQDIEALIRAWGADPAKYQPHVEAQIKSQEEELLRIRKENESAYPEENQDLASPSAEQETADSKMDEVRRTFREKIVSVFQLDAETVVMEINDDIMELLFNNDISMINELVSILFENQEQITSQRIVLDGQLMTPTIGHWLQLFVRAKGAGLFDTVTMMDFITNNDNTKNLSDHERHWLIKLLTLYRNLKFFPGSQPTADPALWQIFPLPEEEVSGKINSPLAPELENPQAHDDFRAPLSGVSTPPVLPDYSSRIRPESSQESAPNQLSVSEALQLQNLLTQFPTGSLERLAIEEELKNYQQ